MLLVHALSFIFGLALVLATLWSAMRTFVVPRSINDFLSRRVFLSSRWVFSQVTRRLSSYAARDRVLAAFGPLTLLSLPFVWVAIVLAGYMCMFWALGIPNPRAAFTISGSSLLTLGFAVPVDIPTTILTFSEAAIGLLLIALLIAYLPTMYGAFSRRELAVTMLEVRAGNPPSAVELFLRYFRLGRMDELVELWETWEMWFGETEETHTSFAALTFFRSPQPDHSWVTAAGAVLDAASLILSTLDMRAPVQANLCIRAGYITLRRLAGYFGIPIDPDPKRGDPISVNRFEFDEACDRLAAAGLPLKPDRDLAWLDFAGWRVNYDAPLLAFAALTMAPEAPWSGDRPAMPIGARLSSPWL